MTALLELQKVSKGFPGVQALRAVDLALQSGCVHALVGENGAGKSTLINILCGVLPPDAGIILLDGKETRFGDARASRSAGIACVHQEVDLFPDLTVAENLGLDRGLPAGPSGWLRWQLLVQQTRQALAVMTKELSPHTLARALSPAQRQMVEIAAALTWSARVLVFDEPTSSLTAAEAEILFAHIRRLRGDGAAILYVSHRLEELPGLADEVSVLRDGCLVWHGLMTQCSRERLIHLMVGRKLSSLPIRAGGTSDRPVRLFCSQLATADGSVVGVTLEVRGGEVLGLYGLIGSGRSEWAQAVFGLRALRAGTVEVDGHPVQPRSPSQMRQAGVAYVPEDRLQQGLCRGLSIRANVVLASLGELARWGWAVARREVRQTRKAIEQLGIRSQSTEQPVADLSGGNQQKVVLARWLGCEPSVLILDEPTRGVDVTAKQEIHVLIRQAAKEGRAVVLISSDLPEVIAHSDRIGVFREGRLEAILDGANVTPENVAAAAVPAGKMEARTLAGASRRRAWGNGLPREAMLVFLLAALYLLIETRSGRFFRAETLLSLASDASLLALLAYGAALVLLAGGLDISVGALMALSAGVAGRLWETGYSLALGAPAALAVGALGGALNASLTILGRVHPIVITLGTMSVYRGLTLWWIQQDIHVPGRDRNWIFAEAMGLPLVAWAALGLGGGLWLFLQRTVKGREVYALGSNPTAARRVGIHRGRVWLLVFSLQGMLAGLAGLLYLARSGSLQATSYEDKTLEAIAAAVVGGIAITGGRGSIWGPVVGCMLLVSLGPACVFLGVPTAWQKSLTGGVLVLAVLADALWRRRDET